MQITRRAALKGGAAVAALAAPLAALPLNAEAHYYAQINEFAMVA